MIRTALEFIKKQLDAYMVEREQDAANYSKDNVAELQSLVAPDGTLNVSDANHITIMLAGLDEERREGKRPQYKPTDDKQFIKLNPPVELDLYVLFIAHKKDYVTALRDLSDQNSQGTRLGTTSSDTICFYGTTTAVAQQNISGSVSSGTLASSVASALIKLGLVNQLLPLSLQPASLE